MISSSNSKFMVTLLHRRTFPDERINHGPYLQELHRLQLLGPWQRLHKLDLAKNGLTKFGNMEEITYLACFY